MSILPGTVENMIGPEMLMTEEVNACIEGAAEVVVNDSHGWKVLGYHSRMGNDGILNHTFHGGVIQNKISVLINETWAKSL